MCAKRGRECTRPGTCLSRGPHRAFSGPQQEHGRRVRPLSSPVIGKRVLEERVARIGTAARGRVVRSARPHGRLARCDCPSPPPAKLNERRRSETIHFRISNLRNRLRPQAPSANQPRANKEKTMRRQLIMERNPEVIKSAGVKFVIQNDGKSQGTLRVSGNKIRWYPKGQSAHGFEADWNRFSSLMEENAKKF